MPFCCLLFCFQNQLSRKFFQVYNHSEKQFGSNQVRHYVVPDLGPNCMQNLSLVDKEIKENKEISDFSDLFFKTILLYMPLQFACWVILYTFDDC